MSPRPPSRRRTSPESGVTLIEIVMAVAIMGAAFVVIVGGIGAAIIGADVQSRQAKADLLLRTAAETIQYQSCAALNTYVPPSAPGFSVTVSRISYWDAATNVYKEGNPGPPADCAENPPLQLIELHVSSVGSTTERLISDTLQVVRRP